MEHTSRQTCNSVFDTWMSRQNAHEKRAQQININSIGVHLIQCLCAWNFFHRSCVVFFSPFVCLFRSNSVHAFQFELRHRAIIMTLSSRNLGSLRIYSLHLIFFTSIFFLFFFLPFYLFSSLFPHATQIHFQLHTMDFVLSVLCVAVVGLKFCPVLIVSIAHLIRYLYQSMSLCSIHLAIAYTIFIHSPQCNSNISYYAGHF